MEPGVNWLVRGESRKGDRVRDVAELRRLRIEIQGHSSKTEKARR